ncbi:2-amino-4-hydroxy-6-hydroxymethyldihydropteridine diphosphokinase [Rhodococcus sp. BP-252]|uniref:2-amino-4-hydroxy-6- hydroxymethyldihydropteridine diphosphokinase n=1 Tax=unclassified Rhodococcus (in: high G+C Gram-positive bacteria) TaxID=192944 RepID=UPI001C9B1214|nr:MULTISPECIES: 2-amino-4-hydroxy-6-hydroxymethyldihydropteridine diphosphokinase [unclassified Rhodococcus (in: high G+C Gram-positive bacteria)]MBY6413251.1 2-amino-4-hydroxy-6-hydroxymethyldihydropteridine diphosphokinase [Rhodococcus sp. BP-320]MBY6418730.1 2-amino-4-hydroxy-6-hydroxymethyldihydropteridine diphosphokinase [Rhodococcus sp. BP-321]MBY6423024.1 2-amino-4-hydroxy-6-hydroxymethyldihydropteridine diphosphokinase [Rhodococcus sp. BP-324]MBY6427994.1 2-amino-4-hydroxy-6-hydroxymet
MTRAVLSIGSNIGDSLAHLRSVVDALGDRLVAASAVYSSEPWGGVEQQNFLNAILIVDDAARGPWEWLDFARACETAADRVRVQRWGPRSLDVDIVVCDDVSSDDPELLLPHPRAHERAFVLIPWLDVDPAATLEVDGTARPVTEWLAALSADERAGVRRTDMTLDTPESA